MVRFALCLLVLCFVQTTAFGQLQDEEQARQQCHDRYEQASIDMMDATYLNSDALEKWGYLNSLGINATSNPLSYASYAAGVDAMSSPYSTYIDDQIEYAYNCYNYGCEDMAKGDHAWDNTYYSIAESFYNQASSLFGGTINELEQPLEQLRDANAYFDDAIMTYPN